MIEVVRTDYQAEEFVDFAVEVGRIKCLRGESFVDLVAVGFAGCSDQRYQRYFVVAVVVGSDLTVGH